MQGHLSVDACSLLPADLFREDTLLAVTFRSRISNKYSSLVNRGRLRQSSEVISVKVNEL
jgi:hypothetical protein